MGKKAEKMKPHVTVKITRELLEKMDACDSGVEDVAKLLPVTLSTDPLENLNIAAKLVQQTEDGGLRAEWLLERSNDYTCAEFAYDQMQKNVYLIAQVLAASADRIATAEGR